MSNAIAIKNKKQRYEEEDILIEKVKLILKNICSISPSISALFLISTFVLINDKNKYGLIQWFTISTSVQLLLAYKCWARLKTPIDQKQAFIIKYQLVIVVFIQAVLWGSLPWIVLDHANDIETIITIILVAVSAGGSAATMSPIYLVYATFATTEIAILSIKVAWIPNNEYEYQSLSVAAILYLLGILSQGKNYSKMIRRSIFLMFENKSLIDKLEIEKIHATNMYHEAVEANKAKFKFIASASHDLRQPVHAQGLFLNVLQNSKLTKKQSIVLNRAILSSKSSSEILNSLFDYSRMEAGSIKPLKKTFDLQDVFSKIEVDLAPSADLKKLIYRQAELNKIAFSDPVLIELILRNLVSNAIKYTDKGGVLLACRNSGNYYSVEIWDTGIGISESNIPEIFREFHQISDNKNERRSGIGLGLSIVNRLSNILDHELTVHSKYGRGSVFKIKVPSAKFLNKKTTYNFSSNRKIYGVKILIIGDDHILLESMGHLANTWGCIPYIASTQKDISSCLSYVTPDLIISDYHTSDLLNEIKITSEIRIKIGFLIPSIIITGDTSTQKSIDTSIVDVSILYKPIDPYKLEIEVYSILGYAMGVGT